MYFVDEEHKKAFQDLAQHHGKEGDYLAAYYILTSDQALRNISLPHIDGGGNFTWSAIQKKFKNLGSTHNRIAKLAYHLYGSNGTVDLTLILQSCDREMVSIIQQAIGVWCFKTKE